jgi:hypothetical protein
VKKVAPNRRSECLGRALSGHGRIGEAIQVLEADLQRSNNAWGALGYAYTQAGRREEARNSQTGWQRDPLVHAMTFAGLGDKDRSLEALKRMAPMGPFRVGRALTFPELALRGDPRVKALQEKVGLPG